MKITLEAVRERIAALDSAGELSIKEQFYLDALRQLEAAMEAEPVGSFHIVDQQVDGTTDYIKDGEWPIDNGELVVYAVPPAPRVEASPVVDAEHVASVLEMIGCFDADDIDSDNVDLRFELDGLETGSDVSITEYATRGAAIIRQLLVTREAAPRVDAEPVAHIVSAPNGDTAHRTISADDAEYIKRKGYSCKPLWDAPPAPVVPDEAQITDRMFDALSADEAEQACYWINTWRAAMLKGGKS